LCRDEHETDHERHAAASPAYSAEPDAARMMRPPQRLAGPLARVGQGQRIGRIGLTRARHHGRAQGQLPRPPSGEGALGYWPAFRQLLHRNASSPGRRDGNPVAISE
jgi:hypothetical protein